MLLRRIAVSFLKEARKRNPRSGSIQASSSGASELGVRRRGWCVYLIRCPILIPRAERLFQHRLALGRFLEHDLGDSIVVEQQREVEPGARLHQVEVAGAVGVAL